MANKVINKNTLPKKEEITQEVPKEVPSKSYPQSAKESVQRCMDELKEIRETEPADSLSVLILKKAIARMEVIRDNIC